MANFLQERSCACGCNTILHRNRGHRLPRYVKGHEPRIHEQCVVVNPVVAAYAAGLLDGEGSVCLVKHSRSEHVQFWATVQIYNTYRPVLDEMRSLFGGCIGSNQRRKEWKVCYVWILRGGRALSFLRAVYPFMRIKRRRAELLLTYATAPKRLEDRETLYEAIKAA